MNWWNPQVWNGIGVVTLAVMVAVWFVVALLREWIVLGKPHRAEIARLDARAVKDAETIATLSQTVSQRQADDDVTTRVLAAIRDAMTTNKSQGVS